MKNCPYCAESIEDAAMFCQYCGHDTGKPPAPPARRYTPAPERPAHEPSQSAAPVIAILLVLAVVVGGVWLAIDGKNLGVISAGNSAAPQPTLPAPSPTPRPQVTPKVVNTAFEASRFAEVLDGWKCKSNNQGQIVFTGKVQNAGSLPLDDVSMQAYIYNKAGSKINSNTGGPDVYYCLRPDSIAPFTISVADHGQSIEECEVQVEAVVFASYGELLCPSDEPTKQPAAKATAGSATSTTGGSLLSTLTRIRKNIQALSQDADVIHCERNQPDSVLNNYEAIVNAPKFNVIGAAQTAAYTDYRSAVDIIARTSKDLYLHCSEWVKGTATTNVVPRQTWGTARQGVDQALQAIDAGLAKLK